MCMGAIIWRGFGRLVFAASVAQIGERTNQIMITSADVAAKAPFLPIKITGGVLADEAVQLFGNSPRRAARAPAATRAPDGD
jgi:tRNA(adenine34) deaminase